MSVIRKFTGDWATNFSWEGSRTRMYKKTETNQVSETWMIGKAEGAQNFAFRYYQLSPGSKSNLEQHPYDHGIIVLQGTGTIRLEETKHTVEKGDIIYIEPDMLHQVSNSSDKELGFICVIPARRNKGGTTVWAEEGIQFD